MNSGMRDGEITEGEKLICHIPSSVLPCTWMSPPLLPEIGFFFQSTVQFYYASHKGHMVGCDTSVQLLLAEEPVMALTQCYFLRALLAWSQSRSVAPL